MEAQEQRPRITTRSFTSSFDEEVRALLSSRLRTVFLIGFLVALSTNIFYTFGIAVKPIVDTPLAPYMKPIYWGFSVLFGLGTILVLSHKWSRRQLLVIDFTVIMLAILLSHFTAAVFTPHIMPLFGVSLLLFIHAAFLPVPVGLQVALGLTTALGYPAALVASYFVFPEVVEFWENPAALGYLVAEGGVGTFRAFVAESAFTLAILAAVSVAITWALYNMRRSLHAAQRLGNYLIGRELGEGGMGRVFIAEHALLCRPTAVKVLKDDTGMHHSALARFEREVMLSATLSHPNTITIYDFGRTQQNTFYYAMEYLEGLDLQRLVEKFGPLRAERVIYVLNQVCGSLAEAHSRDIVHRDIKPSNIFLTNRGGLYDFVKVLDFGLAKELKTEGSPSLTETGIIFGTPLYISPEMAYGEGDVDARADLYSLGGVAYWMLAGRPPFAATSGIQAIIDNVRTDPEPISKVTELPIPAALEEIVMRCLAKKPEERFEGASEMQAALREIRIEEVWTQRRAREWWMLHAPGDEAAAELIDLADRSSSGIEMVEPVVSR